MRRVILCEESELPAARRLGHLQLVSESERASTQDTVSWPKRYEMRPRQVEKDGAPSNEEEKLKNKLQENLRLQRENFERQKKLLAKLNAPPAQEPKEAPTESIPSPVNRDDEERHEQQVRDLAKLRAQCSTLEEKVSLSQEKWASQQAQSEKYKKDAIRWEEKAIGLDKEIFSVMEDLNHFKASFETEKHSRENLENELKLAYERERKLSGIGNEKFVEMQKAVEHLQSQLKVSRAAEMELIQQVQHKTCALEDCEQQLATLRACNQALQEELDERNEQCYKIEAAATQSVAKIQKSIDSVQHSCAKEKEARRKAEVMGTTARQEIQRLEQEVAFIQKQVNESRETKIQRDHFESTMKQVELEKEELEQQLENLKKRWSRVEVTLSKSKEEAA